MFRTSRLQFGEPTLFEGGVEVVLSGLAQDEDGCFCYEPGDPEFAYIHAFYYADAALRRFNDRLAELELDPVRGVTLRLGRYPGYPATGFATQTDLEIDYFHRAIDPFLISHEVGHVVDAAIRDQTGYAGDDFAILEGTANILAALDLGRSDYDRWHRYDGPTPDVNTLVELPDQVITIREVLEQTLAASEYLSVFSAYRPALEEALAEVEFDDTPDDYYTSAVVNQPIWELGEREGAAFAMQLYLRALIARGSDVASYDALAELLVQAACEESPEVAGELRGAYRARGLQLAADGC